MNTKYTMESIANNYTRGFQQQTSNGDMLRIAAIAYKALTTINDNFDDSNTLLSTQKTIAQRYLSIALKRCEYIGRVMKFINGTAPVDTAFGLLADLASLDQRSEKRTAFFKQLMHTVSKALGSTKCLAETIDALYLEQKSHQLHECVKNPRFQAAKGNQLTSNLPESIRQHVNQSIATLGLLLHSSESTSLDHTLQHIVDANHMHFLLETHNQHIHAGVSSRENATDVVNLIEHYATQILNTPTLSAIQAWHRDYRTKHPINITPPAPLDVPMPARK